MAKLDKRLAALQQYGFDGSYITEDKRAVRVACTQCEALVLMRQATHELNCPNTMHECKGCWEVIPLRQRYCADCA